MPRNVPITLEDEELIYDSYSLCKGSASSASYVAGYNAWTIVKHWRAIGLEPLGWRGRRVFLGTCEDYVNLVREERAKKKPISIRIVE